MASAPRPPKSTADQRKAAERAQEVRIYTALGQFVFEFSQLEYVIRYFLGEALGLGDDRFDVVTSPYDFAALCRVSCQVWLTTPGLTNKERKWVEPYFKECLKLNDQRVRILHGTWFANSAGAGARHVSRSTLKANFFFNKDTVKEIKKAAQKAATLRLEMVKFPIQPLGIARDQL
jgi:hypothetical protein